MEQKTYEALHSVCDATVGVTPIVHQGNILRCARLMLGSNTVLQISLSFTMAALALESMRRLETEVGAANTNQLTKRSPYGIWEQQQKRTSAPHDPLMRFLACLDL